MSSTPSDPGSAVTDTTQIAATRGVVNLKRQESRYWYLLGAICIVTATSLAFAISPLLGERIVEVWPWANTQVVLISLLPLSIALLVGYLTIQKQKTRDMRQNLEHIASDAARREFETAYKSTGKRFDVGKSCVRFKKLDDLPLELIGDCIAADDVETFVARFKEASASRSKRDI